MSTTAGERPFEQLFRLISWKNKVRLRNQKPEESEKYWTCSSPMAPGYHHAVRWLGAAKPTVGTKTYRQLWYWFQDGTEHLAVTKHTEETHE